MSDNSSIELENKQVSVFKKLSLWQKRIGFLAMGLLATSATTKIIDFFTTEFHTMPINASQITESLMHIIGNGRQVWI